MNSINIYQKRFVFELLKNKKIKEQSYYVVDRKYSSELGLLIYKVEENTDFNEFI